MNNNVRNNTFLSNIKIQRVIVLLLFLTVSLCLFSEDANKKEKKPYYYILFPTGISCSIIFNDMSDVNKIAEAYGLGKFEGGTFCNSIDIDSQVGIGKDYFLWLLFSMGSYMQENSCVVHNYDEKEQYIGKYTHEISSKYNGIGVGLGKNFALKERHTLAPSFMTGISTQTLTLRHIGSLNWVNIEKPSQSTLNALELYRMDLYILPEVNYIYRFTNDLGVSVGMGYRIGFQNKGWSTFDHKKIHDAPKSIFDGFMINFGLRLI